VCVVQWTAVGLAGRRGLRAAQTVDVIVVDTVTTLDLQAPHLVSVPAQTSSRSTARRHIVEQTVQHYYTVCCPLCYS